jgi:predicted phage terminase large subunit-like protein
VNELESLPSLLDLDRAIYKRSYYEFFKQAYAILHPGERYQDNFHIKYVCEVLQAEAERIQRNKPRDKDLIFNWPFRSSKSLLVSVIFPAWVWTWFPACKFITVSAGESLATSLAVKSRDLIQSEWYRTHFGDVFTLKSDNNAKTSYANNKGGERRAFGMGAQIIGFGADIVLCDDPTDAVKTAASATYRQGAIDYYNTGLSSRLNQLDLGVRIIVMQRLHQEDLAGYLLENASEQHRLISMPAEITDNCKPVPSALAAHYTDGLFWPGRFSREELTVWRGKLGSLGYAGQLQQSPIPEGGNLLHEGDFDILDAGAFAAKTQGATWHAWLDTAYTADAKNDASAVLIGCVVGGDLYVAEVHELRLEFPQLLQKLPQLLDKYLTQRSKVYVEAKASGLSVIQQLRVSTRLNVVQVSPGRDSKYTRAVAASAFVEGRRVKLQAGRWNRDFLAQLTAFPNASHDDMVDVLLYAIAEAQTPARSFSTFVIGS